MQALRGLAWLLAFQSAGELFSRGLNLPFPGPVIGMTMESESKSCSGVSTFTAIRL